jgi:hypothetical protein
MWITVNNPFRISTVDIGEDSNNYEPGVTNFITAHNLLMAHAGVYNLYHGGYAAEQKGRVFHTKNREKKKNVKKSY